MKSTWSSQAGRRGQAVLLAAVVLVVALVPVIAAYLQLGYGGQSSPIDDDGQREARQLLERAVQEHASGIESSYRWRQRDAAAERVRDRLDPTMRQLAQSRLDENTVHQTRYNQSHAASWASARCPGGPNRQFGPCEAIRGVVVQERAGRTHVLAVAVDLSVTTPDGASTLTTVIRVQAG